jgi:hypothetical protein
MAPPMTGESGSSRHCGAERLRDRRLPSGRASNSCDGLESSPSRAEWQARTACHSFPLLLTSPKPRKCIKIRAPGQTALSA